MARILITGAHGFIGRHLARELNAHGHQVLGLGHGNWPDADARNWGVQTWINGDISPANLHRLCEQGGPPERIYHLAGGSSVGAALASPREDFVRTVSSTVELLDWVRQEAPHALVCAVSSAAVYGDGHRGQIEELAPLRPFSPYGYHKRLMEQLCESYTSSFGLRTRVARLFSVYGPHLRKQLLWDLCSRLDAGESQLTLGGSGHELRDWTDVRDVAHALRVVCDLGDAVPPVVNIGTGLGTSVRDVAEGVIRCWREMGGQSAELAFSGNSRPGDPFSLVAAPQRLMACGFRWQLALADGLSAYVHWFRARGMQ